MTTLSDASTQRAAWLGGEAAWTNGVDFISDPSWDRWVAANSGASLFHRSAWARVLSRTYGHKPMGLVLRRGDETQALLPLMEVSSPLTGRRGVCAPFADECGGLPGDGENAQALLEALRSTARQRHWRYFELRGGMPLETAARPSVSFYAHSLDMRDGTEALFQGFDSSVRRAIRKAERTGLRAEIRTDEAAMKQFYRLHVRTRRRHGLPPQPYSFFLHIHQEIVATGLGVVVLVSDGAHPAAAMVFFHGAPQAAYKFGACDERIQESRANNLAMWAGIQHLVGQGCETLHFGRTSLHHEGLRRYKLGWGTAETALDYFKFDLRADAWVKDQDRVSGIHNAVFSHLPVVLNRWLGRLIYPHLA